MKVTESTLIGPNRGIEGRRTQTTPDKSGTRGACHFERSGGKVSYARHVIPQRSVAIRRPVALLRPPLTSLYCSYWYWCWCLLLLTDAPLSVRGKGTGGRPLTTNLLLLSYPCKRTLKCICITKNLHGYACGLCVLEFTLSGRWRRRGWWWKLLRRNQSTRELVNGYKITVWWCLYIIIQTITFVYMYSLTFYMQLIVFTFACFREINLCIVKHKYKL